MAAQCGRGRRAHRIPGFRGQLPLLIGLLFVWSLVLLPTLNDRPLSGGCFDGTYRGPIFYYQERAVHSWPSVCLSL